MPRAPRIHKGECQMEGADGAGPGKGIGCMGEEGSGVSGWDGNGDQRLTLDYYRVWKCSTFLV